MPETPTFVVNDRRKFTSEGELRHDYPAEAPAEHSSSPSPAETKGPQLVAEPSEITAELADLPESDAVGELYPELEHELPAESAGSVEDYPEGSLPPGPTEEQAAEATRAYDATVERLDTAMRAANPGGERVPEMTFERLVQSLYTQALILLGGGAQPGETPRVDILGARETIDMLSILAQKSKGNLSSSEDKLLQSALFDLRMGFLEITQALARQAAQRQMGNQPGSIPGAIPPGGPRIVR